MGEPLVDSQEYQLQAVCDSQLVENLGEVTSGSSLTDPEPSRKVLVCIAGGNQCHDLALTGGKAEILQDRRRGVGKIHLAIYLHKFKNAFLPHPLWTPIQATKDFQIKAQ